MTQNKEKRNIFKRLGKWWPVIVLTWISSHLIVPLAVIRLPIFEKYLIALENKFPINIPWIS